MRFRKVIVLFFVLLLTTSCSDKNSEDGFYFEDSIAIKSSKIVQSKVKLFCDKILFDKLKEQPSLIQRANKENLDIALNEKFDFSKDFKTQKIYRYFQPYINNCKAFFRPGTFECSHYLGQPELKTCLLKYYTNFVFTDNILKVIENLNGSTYDPSIKSLNDYKNGQKLIRDFPILLKVSSKLNTSNIVEVMKDLSETEQVELTTALSQNVKWVDSLVAKNLYELMSGKIKSDVTGREILCHDEVCIGQSFKGKKIKSGQSCNGDGKGNLRCQGFKLNYYISLEDYVVTRVQSVHTIEQATMIDEFAVKIKGHFSNNFRLSYILSEEGSLKVSLSDESQKHKIFLNKIDNKVYSVERVLIRK